MGVGYNPQILAIPGKVEKLIVNGVTAAGINTISAQGAVEAWAAGRYAFG